MLHCGRSKPPENTPAPPPSPDFSGFVDGYFNALFDTNPSQGTAAGLHQYDTKLEDLSANAFSRRIQELHRQLDRLQTLRAGQQSPGDTIDAQVLDGQIRSELQSIEELRNWQKNPMAYVALPGGAIDGLIKRDFAPAAERLRSVIARLKAAPAVLDAMRANVKNPPKEFTDLAIRMGSGSVGFFRDMVAGWARKAAGGDAALLKEFDAANGAFIQALEDGVKWIEKDLQPNSKGSFAIGADAFQNKLFYDEKVHLPLDRLLAIGEANLERDYKDFVETARKIDANKTPAQVFASLANDHPAAPKLLSFAENTLDSVRQFVVDHRIVTIPSQTQPIVTETPPYARSGTFASMDTPGPYETKATEAFYYVTPPEVNWDAQHKEEHLRLFNRPVMDLITIHEAYPGHFVQFLYVKQFPTKTRKLIGVGTNVEGWAHYGEQMMLEQGFGGGDPKIRLAQFSEALLRDCRYVVGIKLHTQGMTVEQGAKVFVEKGFQEPANAYEEARRGAYNPTYLYYTLGKLQILKLREDYRKAKGAQYSLEQFHNEFIRQGGIPIKLVRRNLLQGDKGRSCRNAAGNFCDRWSWSSCCGRLFRTSGTCCG